MHAPLQKTQEPLQSSLVRRTQRLIECHENPTAQLIELAICQQDILHFFNTWVWTYDPRTATDGGIPAHMPFDLYPKQVEFVLWVERLLKDKEEGLAEKSRDMGFTWLTSGIAWHHYRWKPGFKTTFGSRKGEYVDRIGDPDSIFEKIRMLYQSLPTWMLPPGFDPRQHDNSMLLINPENGNTIRGEGGDEMGRGGRSSLYVIDEAAFIERAERVEASTSANVDVRIWGSSVNGMQNFFARKRFGGTLKPHQIFRLHYTDDPRKTPEWAAKKKSTMEAHTWASEFEIDYAASVEGVCIPAAWVESAKKVKKLFPKIEPAVKGIAGGDIGAGKAKSVFVARFGPIVTLPVSWQDPDTIDTAHKMLDESETTTLERSDGWVCKIGSLRYDSIGVGHGITAVMKRNPRPGLVVTGTNVGNPPTDTRWPDGETAQEKFNSLKAEAWWTMRERFKVTHEMVLHSEGKGGQEHPISDLISIPADNEGPTAMQLAVELSMVKWGKNERGKIQIESKKELSGRGIASPDYADALALTFAGDSKAEKWAQFASAAI